MKHLYLLFFFLVPFSLFSQSDKIKLFVECQHYCETEYLIQNFSDVDYVRDRQVADVFIQITRLTMANGGKEFTMNIKGQNQFEGQDYTRTYETEPNIAEAKQLNTWVNEVKLAVLPYIVQTSAAKNLTYTIETPEEEDQQNDTEEAEDPWNLWVFGINGSAFTNGEESYKSLSINGRLTAGRVTDENKLQLSTWGNINRNKFTLNNGEEFQTQNDSKGFRTLYVKSINDHFSVGAVSSAFQSTFGNMDLSYGVAPGIEYNYFPYKEASTKQFTFLYSIGPRQNNYEEITLYDKEKELLFSHNLEIDYDKIEEWGRFNIGLYSNQYLHDLNLYSIGFNPNVSLNVTKGLNINLGGSIRQLRDQISLPKGEISHEDQLLRLRQLSTNYNYFGHFGINYRFGSNNANIVNVRF